ncbi:hypothetical protein [Cupriavidus plantarum]|uniref:hypothetical protein n=1 Tax=Cupriavidus plantarum TaxID=942865 RepID=UPI0011C35A75|nr:hypothetical protein [Cupriavidus plantarum]
MRALIEEWMQRSSELAIKKLALNDCSWADNRDNHQNGFYVPKALFDHGFFPRAMVRREDKLHIHDVVFPTLWLPSGEIKKSRLVHYTNKGVSADVKLTPWGAAEFLDSIYADNPRLLTCPRKIRTGQN